MKNKCHNIHESQSYNLIPDVPSVNCECSFLESCIPAGYQTLYGAPEFERESSLRIQVYIQRAVKQDN